MTVPSANILSDRIVIVGAGQAGVAAATRLRANGHEGRIDLVGDELEPPYQRPPLSKKYMTGAMTRDRLYIKPYDAYSELDIGLLTGCTVIALDRQAKQVRLSGGRPPLDYDRLVLATGSTARKLPDSICPAAPNVFTFRNFADADMLKAQVELGRTMLVVGGGYIGLETAAVARQSGMEVVVVEQAERILQRVACAQTAAYFRDLHRSHGVRVLEAVRLVEIECAGGKASRAVLKGHPSVPFDVAVVGIGIIPNVSLAADAGLDVDGGIVVDGFSRTSDTDIFAAGDCTVFDFDGQRTRLESVHNAIAQAEQAADAMCGKAVGPYNPMPWFWSDQYKTKLQIAGLNRGYTDIVQRTASRPESVSNWYFRGDSLIAVDAINDSRSYMLGKQWLTEGNTPSRVQLGDPAWDLKSFTSEITHTASAVNA